MSIQSDHLIEEVAALMLNAKRCTVITGAGVSAESGIPTFRDAQTGLWAKYSAEELATEAAFRNNPETVWQWYQWRRKLVLESQPNDGHIALAQLQDLLPDVCLVTQNVDGLHQRAGSQEIVEFHGNLFGNRCLADASHPAVKTNPDAPKPPRCPTCGELNRPDVIWFGEALKRENIDRAIEQAQTCQVFLSIGTSSQVHPAADLAMMALGNGAVLIEINPVETPLSEHCSYQFREAAATCLRQLAESVNKLARQQQQSC